MTKYLIKDEPVKGNLLREDMVEGEEGPSTSDRLIPAATNSNKKQIGLSMEEILKYQRDPFYVSLRWIICILIFLLLIGMIVFVVVFIFMQPACPYRPRLHFYQKEIFYQLEVATFKDSNDDGIGDINGIISKLDYLGSDLNAKVLCLSRFISKATPMEIDADYGTKDDLLKLRKETEKRDMFVLIDLPTSYLTGNEEEVFKHWLTRYADGIRLVEGDEKLEETMLSEYTEIAKRISENTFKEKYLGIAEKGGLKLDVETLTIPSNFLKTIEQIYDGNDESYWPNLILGNYDMKRLATVFEKTLYNTAHSLVLLLRGIPVIRAGDELRLTGVSEVHNYMQWDNTIGCGFTANSEIGFYLKNQTSCKNNALSAISHATGSKSLVKIYKELSKLRREPSLSWGDVKIASENKVISFVREAPGFDGYLIATNTGMTAETVDFTSKHNITSTGILAYFNSPDYIESSEFVLNEQFNLENVLLKQGQFMVAKFTRK